MSVDNSKILPKNVKLQDLQENWREAQNTYSTALRRMQLLDATDRGKLWKAINAKFPKYQVLPDTNHVTYIKANLLASLYSVGRSASILPTSEEDKEMVTHLNLALNHIWDTKKVGYYQMLAGERAALTNMGVTQVGWDNSIIKGTGDAFGKGDTVFKNVDPMKFMRDPYAEDLDTAAYCMTWDTYHKNVVLRNGKYKDEFQKYLDSAQYASSNEAGTVQRKTDQPNQPNKDYHKIVTHWVMDGKNIHEIHTVDNKYVLYVKENIKPSIYPFAELFCNIPAGDVVGTSEPSKIFANSVAYNLMNSIVLTAEVKNQKPPKYVNENSGINLRDFIRHGSDSDYTFQVRGDASKAVHYHQFPQVGPVVSAVMTSLGADIKSVTGVDDKYTGKDTGSILTTGGVEQMLDQATLVDQPKIVNYEYYTERLSRLVLGNLQQYGQKRSYFVKDPQTQKLSTIKVDFEKMKDDTVFDYSLNISAHLPKNKQRIAQTANVIMEKQMQYNQEGQQPVELITPEEWLMLQDLPNTEMMMERMGIQRSKDYLDQVAKTVIQYAGFLEEGLDPNDAMMATAEAMQQGEPMQMPQGPMEEPQQGPEMPQMPDDPSQIL